MQTRELAPFSAPAKSLDLVTVRFAYHEIVERGQDRLAFNRRVFEALAADRFYVIAEHAPQAVRRGRAAWKSGWCAQTWRQPAFNSWRR